MAGTVSEPSVSAPVIHVIVPSASVPATSSIFGPSAATSTGHGEDPGTVMLAFALSVSPVKLTVPVRINGTRIDRYSRMCRTGFSNDRPNMFSMTTWCERPMPSTRLPPVAAFTVRACWASIIGWRG